MAGDPSPAGLPLLLKGMSGRSANSFAAEDPVCGRSLRMSTWKNAGCPEEAIQTCVDSLWIQFDACALVRHAHTILSAMIMDGG